MLKKTVFNYEKTILAIADGKQSALLDLYQEESGAMMSLAYARLNDLSFANKAIEYTFKTIYSQASAYSPSLGQAKGWIYSLLNLNIQKIYLQNEEFIPERENSPILELAQIPSSSELEAIDPKKEAFIQLFQQLPEKLQSYLFNMYMSPKTQVEVATDFNLGIGHFREALHEGITYLIEHIELFKAIPHQVKIAEYVLGGLSKNQIDEAVYLLNNDPQQLMALLEWEVYFQIFTEYLSKKYHPNSFVIDYIKEYMNQFDAQRAEVAQKDEASTPSTSNQSTYLSWKDQLIQYWYYIPIVLLAILAFILWFSEPYRQNKIGMVATLMDSQSQPQWMIEYRQKDVELRPLKNIDLPPNHELQVWVEPADTHKAYILIDRLKEATPKEIPIKELTTLTPWDKISIFLVPTPETGDENVRPEGTKLYQGYLLPLNH